MSETLTSSSPVASRDSAAASGRRKPQGALTDRSQTARYGLPLGVLVVALLLWQLVTVTGWVDPLLLPTPGDVLLALQDGLVEGTWWPHVGITLVETVAGFGVGIVVGIGVGALFSFVEPLRVAFYPYVIAMMSMPKIAIAPLLIVALGYQTAPKIIIAGLLAFFPVLVASTAGLSEVDRDELNLMRAIGASRWYELRYLRFPNAMSYVFPSFDVALVGALLGAVAAELVGAKAGLGYLISQAQAYGDVPSMYGVLLVLIVVGAGLRMIVIGLRKVLPMSVVPK